jgi:hypothetical protein
MIPLAERIARVCHEANRGLQAAYPTPGVPVAAGWDEFPADQRAGVIHGVELALDGASPAQLHDAWCHEKTSQGWVWGTVKDADVKTHPCLLPHSELPDTQRVKDRLFAAIVDALKDQS